MTPELKVCTDCKHSQEMAISSGSQALDDLRDLMGVKDYKWVCGREQLRDPVDGKSRYRECVKSRASEKFCGPDGKWWEAK